MFRHWYGHENNDFLLENKHDGPCQSNDISFFLRRINTLASKALVALLYSDTLQSVKLKGVIYFSANCLFFEKVSQKILNF